MGSGEDQMIRSGVGDAEPELLVAHPGVLLNVACTHPWAQVFQDGIEEGIRNGGCQLPEGIVAPAESWKTRELASRRGLLFCVPLSLEHVLPGCGLLFIFESYILLDVCSRRTYTFSIDVFWTSPSREKDIGSFSLASARLICWGRLERPWVASGHYWVVGLSRGGLVQLILLFPFWSFFAFGSISSFNSYALCDDCIFIRIESEISSDSQRGSRIDIWHDQRSPGWNWGGRTFYCGAQVKQLTQRETKAERPTSI